MTSCRDLAPLLDELLDGTLDERRASAVRGHLRACAACARRFEETRELVEAAARLEPLDPPPSLWARIDARLAEDEIADSRRPRWWWWWQAWKRPVAWTAAAACAGAIALATWALRARPTSTADSAAPSAAPAAGPPSDAAATVARATADPAGSAAPPAPSARDVAYESALAEVARVDAEYARAIDELKRIAGEERARWRPEVARAFDENLAAIDAAVERQREACRQQPGDVLALDALYASYRREIDFLQEVVLRGEVAKGAR